MSLVGSFPIRAEWLICAAAAMQEEDEGPPEQVGLARLLPLVLLLKCPPLDQHRRPGLTVRLMIWRSLKTITLGLLEAQKTWHDQEDSQKCSLDSCSDLWTSTPSGKLFRAPLFLQFPVVLQCVWFSPSDTPILSEEVAPLWGFFSLLLKGFPHSSSGPTSPDTLISRVIFRLPAPL